MVESIYYELLDKFGEPKTNLWWTLNAFLPPLKCTSLKHLWDIIEYVNFTRQRVWEVIRFTTTKSKIGRPTNLLSDKEVYILATVKMEVAHIPPKYSISLINNLQQVLHFVGNFFRWDEFKFHTIVFPQNHWKFK